MQNSLKFLMAAALLLQVPIAMAWNPFGSKLQVYECKTRYEANTCSSGCKAIEDVQIEFKVNVEKSLVTRIDYENGKQSGSVSFENCKVIDVKNWSCEQESDTNSSTWNATQSMANGRFQAWYLSTRFPNPRLGTKLKTTEVSNCAK